MRRLLLAGLLLLAGHLSAAPAPRPPRHAWHVRPGCYLIVWGGAGRWRTTLSPGGHYRAEAGGSAYEGRWSYDPAGRVLEVTERRDPAGEGAEWRTYRWVMDGCEGRGEGVVATVRLEREGE